MVAAGEEFDFQEGVVMRCGDEAAAEAGFFGSGGTGGGPPGGVGAAVFAQVVAQFALGGMGGRLDDGPVDFGGLGVSEGGGEAAEGFGCFGEDEGAAGWAIEAVGEADEDIAGFGIPDSDVVFHDVEYALVAGAVGLDEEARRFVHGQKVVVFVQYFKGGHKMFNLAGQVISAAA